MATVESGFRKLSLSPIVVDAIEHYGYKDPSPTQLAFIPPGINRENLIGIGPTGSGKTAAAVISFYQQVHLEPKGDVRVLVIVPQNELAGQFVDTWNGIASKTGHRGIVLNNEVDFGTCLKNLRRCQPTFIAATPHRLLDHIKRRSVNLSRVGHLGIDEIDRMTEFDFPKQLAQIIDALPRSVERQTIMFSATRSEKVKALASIVSAAPRLIPVTDKWNQATVHFKAVMTEHQDRKTLLVNLITQGMVSRPVVFVGSIDRTDMLAKELRDDGFRVGVIHGDLDRDTRSRAMQFYLDGRVDLLVGTDVMARGLDIPGLTDVVNFDIPMTNAATLHRSGRVGRLNRNGPAQEGRVWFFIHPKHAYFVGELDRCVGIRPEVTDVRSSLDDNGTTVELRTRDRQVVRMEKALQYEFLVPHRASVALNREHLAPPSQESGQQLESLGESILRVVLVQRLAELGIPGPAKSASRLLDPITFEATPIGVHLAKAANGVQRSPDDPRKPISIMAAFKRLVGALYADSNFEQCRNVILRVMSEQIEAVASSPVQSKAKEVGPPPAALERFFSALQAELRYEFPNPAEIFRVFGGLTLEPPKLSDVPELSAVGAVVPLLVATDYFRRQEDDFDGNVNQAVGTTAIFASPIWSRIMDAVTAHFKWTPADDNARTVLARGIIGALFRSGGIEAVKPFLIAVIEKRSDVEPPDSTLVA